MIFRILVVDDESFVTDWISHILTDNFKNEAEVYKCSDSQSALQSLLTGVYDIAILDINMPTLTGLDLLYKIIQQNIDTNVIFLTARDEFEFAKKAISQQVVAYVLKGEPDKVLLDAVKEAMMRIQKSIETKKLLKIANDKIEAALPTIRREYIIKILQGIAQTGEQDKEIPLLIDTKKPIMMLICSPNSGSTSLSLLLEMGVRIEEFIGRYFVFEGAMPERSSFVWLLQSKSSACESCIPMLLTAIENAQTYFNRHTGMDLLFVYKSVPFSFSDAAIVYDQLAPVVGYGNGKSHIVLTEDSLPRFSPKSEEQETNPDFEPTSRYANILHKLLEYGEKDECLAALEKCLFPLVQSKNKTDIFALEIFLYVSATALSYINKTGCASLLSAEMSFSWLGRASDFQSWQEAAENMKKLYVQLFQIQTKKRDNRSQACISKAREYILNNLDQDLSLIMLAEKVYLNPSYFSLLFKSKVGCNVSDFIKAERLKRAKAQLVDTKLKINEIARNVGYPNAAYFGKFIKQETGLTPLEYRNKYA